MHVHSYRTTARSLTLSADNGERIVGDPSVVIGHIPEGARENPEISLDNPGTALIHPACRATPTKEAKAVRPALGALPNR